MEIGTIIASNLNELRTARNLSISQLAKLSGVSKAMLSDMEKGTSNPTINTLWKVANALNVHYTRLTEQKKRGASVVRKAEAVMQTDDEAHYRVYCYYPSTPERNFELFYAELDPGASSTSVGHPPRAKEYIYVLSGVLDLATMDESFTLNAGDAIAFAASQRHTYANLQDELLRFLILNDYPEK